VALEKGLNDTLEEQLRVLLVEHKKENNRLRDEIERLKKMVAEEQEGKYRAYRKFADLQQEFKKSSK